MPILYNNNPTIIHTVTIHLVRGNPVFRATIVSPGETPTFRASCVWPGVTTTFRALQSRPRKTPTFRAPHTATMCGGCRASGASRIAGLALGNSLHDNFSLPCGPRHWYFSIPSWGGYPLMAMRSHPHTPDSNTRCVRPAGTGSQFLFISVTDHPHCL